MKITFKHLWFRFLARLAGGKPYYFEGHDSNGKWHRGIGILTDDGLEAMRASFRVGATTIADTGLVDLDHVFLLKYDPR